MNVIENRQEQNILEHKSKNIVTTHLIDDWIIRESSEPFQRKENERLTPIKQLLNQEKKIVSNESITSGQHLPSNVNQWTVSFCGIRLVFNQITNKIAPILSTIPKLFGGSMGKKTIKF